MNSQPFRSAEIRNVIAAEFMRIAGCARIQGEHGYICEMHATAWTDSGCLQTIEAANDLLIPVMEVIRTKVLPAAPKGGTDLTP